MDVGGNKVPDRLAWAHSLEVNDMGNSNSNPGKQVRALLVLVLALVSVAGCQDEDGSKAQVEDDGEGSAVETNVAPAPCDDGSDCPEGIECVFPSGEGQSGFCDVNEMGVADAGADAGDAGGGVSSAAPAPCEDASDCPDGIECVLPDGEGGPGFCNVEEMGISPSSAAPAPCASDDDCPEGIACVSFNGEDGPGFCDVNEMIAD
jgi:hypothetical protein